MDINDISNNELDLINDFENMYINNDLNMNDNDDDNEIHMHKLKRGVKKCDIIIQGLNFKTLEEIKLFISNIRKKLGISGCYKMMEDYDKKNNVFIFSGDKRDFIRDYLVEILNKKSENIIYHG